jgi:hypothetical protein
MTDQDDKLRVNPGYALGQLTKALSGKGERAATRVTQWQRVIAGMLKGTLQFGSRTPVANTSPWVTLEVVCGGFATGSFAAAGSLRPHEVKS